MKKLVLFVLVVMFSFMLTLESCGNCSSKRTIEEGEVEEEEEEEGDEEGEEEEGEEEGEGDH